MLIKSRHMFVHLGRDTATCHMTDSEGFVFRDNTFDTGDSRAPADLLRYLSATNMGMFTFNYKKNICFCNHNFFTFAVQYV